MPAIKGGNGLRNLAQEVSQLSNRSLQIFLIFLAAFCAITIRNVYLSSGFSFLTGDEPHYLVAARSIAEFHSLEMTKAYDNVRSQLPWFPSVLPQNERHVLQGLHGWYLGHGLGLPFLLAVPYVTAGPLGSLFVISFFSALAVVYVYRTTRKIVDEHTALATTFLMGFASLILPFSNQIYPEPVFAFLLIYSTYQTFFGAEKLQDLVVTGFMFGFSAWLKLNFSLAMAPLMIYLVVANRKNLLRELSLTVPVAALVGLLGYYNLLAFGNPFMIVPQNAPASLSFMKWWVTPLFDRYHGLVVFWPLVLLTPLGFIPLFSRAPSLAAATLWPVLVLYVSAASFIGTALVEHYPARFLVPAFPTLAIFLASSIASKKRSFLFEVALFILSYFSLQFSTSIAWNRAVGLTSQNLAGKSELLRHVYFGFEGFFPTFAEGMHLTNYAVTAIILSLLGLMVCKDALRLYHNAWFCRRQLGEKDNGPRTS